MFRSAEPEEDHRLTVWCALGNLSTAYLLHNGLEYHIAHATGVLEFILSETFLPPHLKQWKHVSSLTLAGEPHLLSLKHAALSI